MKVFEKKEKNIEEKKFLFKFNIEFELTAAQIEGAASLEGFGRRLEAGVLRPNASLEEVASHKYDNAINFIDILTDETRHLKDNYGELEINEKSLESIVENLTIGHG